MRSLEQQVANIVTDGGYFMMGLSWGCYPFMRAEKSPVMSDAQHKSLDALIEDNLALALISTSPFVRMLARESRKEAI